MKRRFLFLAIIITIVITLVACKNSEESSVEKESSLISDESGSLIPNESNLETSQSKEEESSTDELNYISFEITEDMKIISFQGLEKNTSESLPKSQSTTPSEKLLSAFEEYNDGEVFCVNIKWYDHDEAEALMAFSYEGKTYIDLISGSSLWTEEVNEAYKKYITKYRTNFFYERGIALIKQENWNSFIVMITEEQFLNLELPQGTGFYSYLYDAEKLGCSTEQIKYFDTPQNVE